MKTNSKMLTDFLSAQKEYKKQEKRIENYFRKQVKDKIEKANTKEDLQEVKEFLRSMPQIAGKVLLFREIIIKENSF